MKNACINENNYKGLETTPQNTLKTYKSLGEDWIDPSHILSQ